MEALFTLENLLTFFMLLLLQAVLGFDNLLYISIESKRVTPEKQAFVRRMGIGVAIGLRLVLLFVVLRAVQYFQDPFWEIHWTGVIEGSFNVHALIVLIGGAFIMYTALKCTYVCTQHLLSRFTPVNTAAKTCSSGAAIS